MQAFTETPLADISLLFERQAATALALRRSSPEQRAEKLRRLRDALLARREAFYSAFKTDLGKPAVEVDLTEFLPVVDEIQHALAHLKRWMRPQRVAATLTSLGTSARIVYQPRGRCLIIGPWNYPLNTVVGPLVSAVAAGNTAIIKPSEMTPAVNAVVAELLAAVFDPAEVAVVLGAVECSQHLLSLPFEHIFFTGSPAVGKLVMAAAAQHLCSVTLELGGKSPAIVDQTADLHHAAELLVWGKLTNTGQTCVAPDHLYVHRSVYDEFLALCRSLIAARYGADEAAIRANPDYGRIINSRHAARIGSLIDDAVARGARVLAGGQHDAAQRYVAPTLLGEVPDAAAIASEEIFGPVLPVRVFDSLDEVIARINAAPKPLALYLWSRDAAAIEQLTRETSSGGLGVNLCLLQYAHGGLPFGGVNNSGLGNAHGFFGFKAFAHERAVLKAGPWMALKLLFPPYTPRKAWLSWSLIKLLRAL